MSRIPTHRSILRRAGAALWQALEDHKWIPAAVAAVALYIINS